MNLIILDKDFQPLAPINTLLTLIWDRRYREPGMFELHAGVSDFDAIRSGAYVYRADREEFGIIYEADIRRKKDGIRTCYAKGYFGEALLNDRVLNTTQRLKGTPEEVARALVSRYFIDAGEGSGDYPGRSLEGHLILGDFSDYTEQSVVEWQGTGSAVGDSLYQLEAEQGLSHRVVYDYENDKLLFSVWRGKDRNALLSDKFGNLTETSYHRDTTDAPNIVYVAGAGDGASRKVLRLDLREEGEGAREMYVDARDLQQTFIGEDGNSYSYTDEDYQALLEARGKQKVAEHQAQERFEAALDATANLVYRQDYDLGDFCVAEVDGVRLERQITGIRETYENGCQTLEVTLGDYAPTSILSLVSRQAQVNVSSPPSTDLTVTGDLNNLQTANKTNLVAAINEVASAGAGGEASWPPATVYKDPNYTEGTYASYNGRYAYYPVSLYNTIEHVVETGYIAVNQILVTPVGPLIIPPELVGVGSGDITDDAGVIDLKQTNIQVLCRVIITQYSSDFLPSGLNFDTTTALSFTIERANWVSATLVKPRGLYLSLKCDRQNIPFSYDSSANASSLSEHAFYTFTIATTNFVPAIVLPSSRPPQDEIRLGPLIYIGEGYYRNGMA